MDNLRPPRVIAGFWFRSLAVVIDVFLIWLGYYAFLWAGWKFFQNIGPAAILIWMGVVGLVWTVMIGGSGKGSTPAGALVGLRLTSLNGSQTSWIGAAVRTALFTLWVFTFTLPEALAVISPIGGHPLLKQVVWAYSLCLMAGFALLMPWDAQRRSPLDLFSGTRVIHDSPRELPIVVPQSRMPGSTLRLLYVLLAVVLYAAIDRWPSRTRDPLPGSPRQMLEILRWFHAHTTLIAPRIGAIHLNRMALPGGQNVPTLEVVAWVPSSFLAAAKERDAEIYTIESELKKTPELTKGFLQLDLILTTDVRPEPFVGKQAIPFYTDLAPDAAAARYYLEHPQVTISTSSVISRYVTDSVIPRGWWDRLYKQHDYKGITQIIQQDFYKGDDLDGMIAAKLIDHLTRVSNGKQFDQCKSTLDEWVKREPHAALPLILRGELHDHYAWDVRGGNFSMYVDKTQWQPFMDQMNAADADFRAASRLDTKNPVPWSERIDVVRAMQQQMPSARHLLEEALHRCPWEVEARHSYMHGLTPQWGGSFDEMAKFSAECEKTAARYPLAGTIELQSIDLEASSAKDQASIYGGATNWPVIQRVYERIFKRYPKENYYRAQYAWYAYSAGKYAIAAEQFAQLGDHFYVGTYWQDVGYYNTSRAYAYNQKGWVYLQRNDLDTGMPWLLQALNLNPFDTWPMAKLATCYQRKNDVVNAEKWANKTLQNNPPILDKQEAEGVLTWVKTQPHKS